MADSKKYNGSTWEHSLRKLATSTDTFTTLPVDVYADGNNATVGLQGNMSQTGTPTPDNPIMPNGTGDRTGNLFNADSYYANYKSGNSYIATTANFNNTIISPFTTSDIGKTYTISCDITDISSTNVRWIATINGVSVNGDGRSDVGQIKLTFTVATANDSIRITYGSGNYSLTITKIIMNKGSTAIPYEPYGFEIPISSANTTSPVYLGEVESTRQIKKYEMTGSEDITYQSAYSRFFFTRTDAYYSGTVRTTPCICSHYQSIHDGRSIDDIPNESIYIATADNKTAFNIKTTDFTDATDFKAYLAQQYANGTPITIWYILTTPTTGIVNEPLRKIGNYADTVSGITIPTITGKDTFDVQTTLKPSEVSLTYTGWHDAEVKEWDGSEWQ